MRIIDTEIFENKINEMVRYSCLNLTPCAVNALNKARDNESGINAKFALSSCLENLEIAIKEKMPVCQDTGMAVFIIEIGQEVFLKGEFINDVINRAVKHAYKDGYFRKSVCDPITRKNTTDNTPAVIHTDIVKGDKVKINFLPKGFGSENMSKIFMLTPSKGVEGIIESIVETVRIAGSNPCPPVYVGVGIGGTFDKCAFLAKKALLRNVGENNLRDDISYIEKESLKRINELKIGAQGFKGDTTALGVSIETSPTHIAGLPVAVNIQCHCIRHESFEI
jgi:fumarate hydratase subunit alpha